MAVVMAAAATGSVAQAVTGFGFSLVTFLWGAAIVAGYVAGVTTLHRLSAVMVGNAITGLAMAGGFAAVIRGIADM